MILDARRGVKGRLWDLDAGREVPHAVWAYLPDDGGRGRYVAARTDAAGNPVVVEERQPDGTVTARVDLYVASARLRFDPATPAATLELPFLRRDRELVRTGRQAARPVSAFCLSDRCDHPGCNAVGDWAVSDEVALPPVRASNGRWYSRARVVRVRYYCARHYRAPALVDGRGELIKVFEDGNGVRPGWHST